MKAEKPVVVLTGAGRGIGRAIARAFAAEGASLYLISRTGKELEETAKAVVQAGGKASWIAADLGNPRKIEELYGKISKETDRVDILINNAGMLRIAPFAETSPEIWDETLRTNLTAPFLLTKAFLPLLQKSNRPHIFNVLSIAARVPFAGSSAYCASKAGLLGLNGVLREEFRPLGIRVTAVIPGATNTKMFDAIPGTYDRSKFVQPEDIAAAVLNATRLSKEANVDEIQIRTVQGI